MAIIAMTREMGTLGKDVAREFARRMNYTVIHHELVESPRERADAEEESEVYRFLEGREADLDFWRNNRAKDGYLTLEEVYELALEGDVLIRGWGATRLLKPVPNILSIRVCAPMRFRIDQMKQRLGIDDHAAEREIERSDSLHGRTLLRFFEADWRDPLEYDFILNTEHLSPALCADILCDAAANPAFAETEQSRRVLRDRLLQSRIASALTSDRVLGRRGRHIRIDVSDAEVRLYGVVTDGQSRTVAERVAAEQEGVRGLRNDIVRIESFA